MRWLVNTIVVIAFVVLLLFAIVLLMYLYICDEQKCMVFQWCSDKNGQEKILFLLDKLCEDGMWPFAYISSAILAGLFFAILPIRFTIAYFAIVFLLSFLVFYAIMSFLVHHYVKPIKQYIIDYIRNHP
jgi:hypothetical protein